MTLQIFKCIQSVKTYMYSEKTGLFQVKLEDICKLPIVINKEYGDNSDHPFRFIRFHPERI